MSATQIEWTDATWNPTTGCSRVSKGCDLCYAMHMARRFDGQGHGYDDTTRRTKRGTDWNGRVKTHDDRLPQPLSWQRPRRVFVNSMSDLFHPGVPEDFIDKVFAVMSAAPAHTFQVLTKRPDRMAEYMSAGSELWLGRWPQAIEKVTGDHQSYGGLPQNIWMGTSVEDGEVTERVDELRSAEAAVRFLSLEPLIGPLPDLDLDGIHWVIVGGESGHDPRPMKEEWALDILEQCREADVPFFFKQWGSRNKAGEKVGKKAAGRELVGQTWDQMPPLASLSA